MPVIVRAALCKRCQKNLRSDNKTGLCARHHSYSARARASQVAWRKRFPERSSASSRRWQQRHKDQVAAYTRNRAAEKRAFLASVKLTVGCVDCGYRGRFVALAFDHVGTDKVKDLSHMVGFSWGKVIAELDKCEVVCHNCHAVRTEERKLGAVNSTSSIEVGAHGTASA